MFVCKVVSVCSDGMTTCSSNPKLLLVSIADTMIVYDSSPFNCTVFSVFSVSYAKRISTLRSTKPTVFCKTGVLIYSEDNTSTLEVMNAFRASASVKSTLFVKAMGTNTLFISSKLENIDIRST